MLIGLVGNQNGKGLQLDSELLASFLTELGHSAVHVQFDQPCDQKFDLMISLEVVNENFFSLSPKHIWIPNLEWTKTEYLLHVRKFDRIWAKTRDAYAVLGERFTNVTYTGFLSRDRLDVRIGKERKFLHVGGDSGLKNTNAVLAAWREWKYWMGDVTAPLTVISRSIHTEFKETRGITFMKEVGDEELRRLQNSHLFHLQPSAYEGYGHALRESQSVGAVLLTTGAGPMEELHAPFEVVSILTKKTNMATTHIVSGREVRAKVSVMLEQPSQMIARYQVDARARWVRGQEESRERLREAVGQVQSRMSVPVVAMPATVQKHQTLAILGNFRPEHSTENDLLWTLDDMGYDVFNFQEDTIPTDVILKTCQEAGVELLIYVHTHGWSTPGLFDLDVLWKRLSFIGTKTCSFHLDRYWGLNQLDQRENNIGKHAFWHTDRVFTADGGNQGGFAARGISHHWLPPAVVKRDCFSGVERGELRVDVGFVGATSYHPEYSFREELISFLHDTYRDRFRVFQGVRGQELNDVYASTCLLVGDSCFGGADYYWSDRVPETTGRGGFLVHPSSRGLTIPGIIYFTPADLLDLKDKIDWWLVHPEQRDQMRHTAMEWVRDNETYHNRMSSLLSVMGVQ